MKKLVCALSTLLAMALLAGCIPIGVRGQNLPYAGTPVLQAG